MYRQMQKNCCKYTIKVTYSSSLSEKYQYIRYFQKKYVFLYGQDRYDALFPYFIQINHQTTEWYPTMFSETFPPEKDTFHNRK